MCLWLTIYCIVDCNNETQLVKLANNLKKFHSKVTSLTFIFNLHHFTSRFLYTMYAGLKSMWGKTYSHYKKHFMWETVYVVFVNACDPHLLHINLTWPKYQNDLILRWLPTDQHEKCCVTIVINPYTIGVILHFFNLWCMLCNLVII